MNFISNLFSNKTRPIWTVGLPAFVIVFFLPYWLIVCPLLWRKFPAVGVNNRAWNSPWLYGYWLAAAGVWIFVYIAATYCCKGKNNQQNDEDYMKSTEKLLPTSQTFKTSTPFHITSLPVQPKREEGEIPTGSSIQQHIRGIDISYAYVQPKSSLKSMPPSRPSENEFTWDNEDIPWSHDAESESLSSFYSLDNSNFNFDFVEQHNAIEEEKNVETAEGPFPEPDSNIEDTTLCAGTSASSEEETVIEKTLLDSVTLRKKENLNELTDEKTIQFNDSTDTTPSPSADAIDSTSNADQSLLDNDSGVKRRFKDRDSRPCWNAADITRLNSSIKRTSTLNLDGKRKSKR